MTRSSTGVASGPGTGRAAAGPGTGLDASTGEMLGVIDAELAAVLAAPTTAPVATAFAVLTGFVARWVFVAGFAFFDTGFAAAV